MQCEEIRIGALYPLTGDNQLLGESILQALELLVDLVNRRDHLDCHSEQWLPDLDGKRVKLIWGDTKGDPLVAQDEARRLIEKEGVTSLIGCYQSNATSAVSYQAEVYGIPFLSPDADAASLTDMGFRWFFRTGPTSRIYTERLFDMLEETRFCSATLGSLMENSLLGRNEVQALIKLSQEYGREVNVIELFGEGTPVTKDMLYRIKAAKPDFFVIPTAEEQDLEAIRISKEIRYCPLAFLNQTSFFALEELLKLAGKDADYVISTAAWAPGLTKELPLAAEINRLYKCRYGENMNTVNALSFTGLYTLLDAISRARSDCPCDIKRALACTDIPCEKLIVPWKGIRFGENGQNSWADSMVVQVLDGTNKIVWPKCFAQACVVIPVYPCD